MKIKHKWLGVELPVQNESVFIPRFFGRFYETVGGSLIAHDDNDWQLVKEEEWEDVTGEVVESRSEGNWAVDGRDILGLDVAQPIRLRKIDGPHNGPCFIVERRKS